MNIKQKIDMIIDSFLVVLGIFIIILGILKYDNIKTIFVSSMFAYALLNFIQYFLTRKSNDMEGLYTTLACLLVGIADIYFPFNNNLVLSVSIMIWALIMSIIKFIKADYYNDRKDKMWKLRVISLILFIVIAILTSVSLNYNHNVQVMIIGYFFLIHGILELIDPITNYLIGK